MAKKKNVKDIIIHFAHFNEVVLDEFLDIQGIEGIKPDYVHTRCGSYYHKSRTTKNEDKITCNYCKMKKDHPNPKYKL